MVVVTYFGKSFLIYTFSTFADSRVTEIPARVWQWQWWNAGLWWVQSGNEDSSEGNQG